MADDIRMVKVKNGWLAERERYPRVAGFGGTPEQATAKLDLVISAFNRSLAKARQIAASPDKKQLGK